MNSEETLNFARRKYPNDENLRVAYMLGFNDGADRKEEQMMNGSVEGQIVSKNDGWNSIELPSTFFGDLSRNYNHGDKVRIIVCKNED